ncbi:ead/Ea22-like family protein, partial [Escherichia coli]|uniref:ead/Ea22-like family protein n=1 Tax=Escherichia coli TaxID=562 RepID=UPI00214FE21D
VKQALNQEKIEWLNKLADMEYRKSNPEHWLMSLKYSNMLAKLARCSVALLASLEAAEKRIAELEARAFNPAILDVIAERQRQQSVEGWMPEHDDEHCNGELAMAAVCYINETGTVNRNGGKPWGWPW